MRAVGLGDLAAAARVLMAAPAHRRAGLMRMLIAEADLAHRHWWVCGRLHPCLGNGTLMGAALAHPQKREASTSDAAFLACLAEVLEAVIAWRATEGLCPPRRVPRLTPQDI